MKRAFIALMSVSLAFAGASCNQADEAAEDVTETAGPGADQAANSGRTIEMKDTKYDPARLVVPLGTEVTWVNRDDIEHTLTTDDGAFDSGPLKKGQKIKYVFPKTGKYDFHCAIHGKDRMSGSVVVE